jgi:hypothetical protein
VFTYVEEAEVVTDVEEVSTTWFESGWLGKVMLGKLSDAAADGDVEVSMGDARMVRFWLLLSVVLLLLLLLLMRAPRLGVRDNENRDNDERRRGKNRKLAADFSVLTSKPFGLAPPSPGLRLGVADDVGDANEADDDGERASEMGRAIEDEVTRSSLGSDC